MKNNRFSIFISYSHADEPYLKKMKRHFSFLNRKVEIWDDSKILAGQLWRSEINNALNKAKIAILLISADFFYSKFITEVELPLLLQAAKDEGAIIIPLIVKPCLFNESELSQFQSINDPNRALSKISESEQEEIFVKIASQISSIL